MTKETNLTSFSGCILSHSYNIFHSFFGFLFRLGGAPARWGERWGTAYPLGGRGFSGASGRSAPGARRLRRGSPTFFEESRGKEHQGGRGSSSLDLPFLVWGDPARVLSFFCLACGPVSYARNGPPPSWAGWEGVVLQTGREAQRKAFPSGGRCPSAHTGADEGAILYPTFPCRKKALSRLSPQRGFSIASLGNPVAPSSVTFGDSFPPRGSL